MADTSRRPRWLDALLRTCLMIFPRADRDALGEDLLAAARESLAARPERTSLIREGLAEAAAIVAGGLARRRQQLAEAARSATNGWSADIPLALRSVRRNAAFSWVVAGTLAVGFGVSTSIFSLVDSVLLRPPPYPNPDELVAVWNSLPGSDERIPLSGPDAAVLAERSERLRRVAFTIRGVDGAIHGGGSQTALHVRISSVTSDFFDVLGIAPALGRTFTDDDASAGPDAGTPLAVVLADRLWRDELGGDSAVLGADIRLNGWPVSVVGVMPGDFTLPLPPDAGVTTDVDVWIPLTVPLSDFHREGDRLQDRDSDNTGVVVARLAPGATVAHARAELDGLAIDLQAEVPAYASAGLGFDVRPLVHDATAHARPVLLALLTGAGALLLVLIMNVATLLLARGLARGPELSLRLALGGGRGRIVRQLLVEHGALVAAGLLGALALAIVITPALGSLVPPSLYPTGGIVVDLRTGAFAAALAVGAVLLLGLVPAVQVASRDARGALGPGIAAGRTGRSVARRRLVASQVALSVVLVVGAGLLLRSVRALAAVDPGFDASGALTFRISLRMPDRYRSPAYRAELMKEIERRVAELPGVRSIGLVGVLPLGGDRWSQPYGLPGQPRDAWQENRADFQMISSGYFEAVGARLLEGRTFTALEDLEEDERVVVVDQKLAARIAPAGSAVGLVIGIPLDGAAVQARVVGVVGHIRHDRLDADGREAIYVPYRQEASRDVTYVVRTAVDPGSLAPAVRQAVRGVDPEIPVYDLIPLDEYVDAATAPHRFALAILVAFAALTLVGAAIGLYGVIAYDVARGRRDIGIRLAMGASQREVVRSVVVDGVRLGATGLAVGVLLGLLVARGMGGLLVGVHAADVLTWSGVVVLVLMVVATASWIPARRASRLAPIEALRRE
jgi:putative ABC transport system permease protein